MAKATPTRAPVRRFTQTELETIILELLAELDRKDPDVLRTELEANGGGLPVDSLDMFDIMQGFHQATGINIPVKSVRRRTMRSVTLFAQLAAETSPR